MVSSVFQLYCHWKEMKWQELCFTPYAGGVCHFSSSNTNCKSSCQGSMRFGLQGKGTAAPMRQNEATCVTKAFPVSAVSGHAAPRTTPLLHIHHPAHAVLGDTRTDRHNPASVSKQTPASPSTARTLRNDLCPSASPQQSARGFSTSFPTAADAEQELCLAPVPGEQARTSVPGKLWMSSKVRQSSPVRAPLGTGAGKPILAKPFPPWNTWISRNGRPDPLLLYKI